MSLFGAALADHLAESLNIEVSDATEALNSFLGLAGDEVPIKKTTKKTAKATTTVKNNKTQPEKTKDTQPVKKGIKKDNDKPIEKTKTATGKHTCERIKRGQTDPCGKNATKDIGSGKQQKWFCGGCYPAEINAQAKKNLAKKDIAVNTTNKTQTKPQDQKSKVLSAKTNEERKKISDSKSTSLVHGLLGKLNVTKRTINGEKLYVERTKKLLFDFDSKEFYGMLDDDNNKLPISDDLVKWIESHGHYVRQDPNIKQQAKHKSRDKPSESKDTKSTTKSITKEKKKQQKAILIEDEEDELPNEEENEDGSNEEIGDDGSDEDELQLSSDEEENSELEL